MSLISDMGALPTDKLMMLIGVVLALIGIIPLIVGAAIIIGSPSQFQAGLTVIAAGGALIGISVLIFQANTNGKKMNEVNGKLDGITPCLKPESEPKCRYEGPTIGTPPVSGFPAETKVL